MTRKLAVKKFRAAETEQDGGEQIGSGADHEIAKAGDDRAERPDEILRRDGCGDEVEFRNGTQDGRSFGA